MTDRIAIGLIGCGFFSRNHLNSWKDLAPEGADLVAVCDIDPAKAKAAAEAFGVPHWYTDAETMFRERNLGLVDIVTRMDTHRRARRDGGAPQGADDRAKAVRAGHRRRAGDRRRPRRRPGSSSPCTRISASRRRCRR